MRSRMENQPQANGINNCYLLIPYEKGWHPLPPHSIYQEENIIQSASIKNFSSTWMYQKDGSRFKCIVAMKDPAMVVKRLYKTFPDMESVLIDSVAPVPIIHSGNVDEYDYAFYWLHTFSNGYRGVPTLVHPKSRQFWNLSNFFPKNIPNDRLGILFKDAEVLRSPIPGLDLPRMIPYLSKIRLCKECGLVSNWTIPRKDPWMGYISHCETLEHEHRVTPQFSIQTYEDFLARQAMVEQEFFLKCAALLPSLEDLAKKPCRGTS